MTSRVISNFFKNTQRPIYNPTQISLDVAAWNSLFKVAWGCHEPKCCMYIYYLHCESKLSDHTPVKNIICKLANPSGYCASLDRADYIKLEDKTILYHLMTFFDSLRFIFGCFLSMRCTNKTKNTVKAVRLFSYRPNNIRQLPTYVCGLHPCLLSRDWLKKFWVSWTMNG